MTHSASICHNRTEQPSDIWTGISYSGCFGKFSHSFQHSSSDESVRDNFCRNFTFFLWWKSRWTDMCLKDGPKKVWMLKKKKKKNTSVFTLLLIRRSRTARALQSSPSLEKPFNSTCCIRHRSCLFMLVWRSHQWILLPPLLSDEAAYLGAPPHLSFGPRSDKVTREWQSRLQLSRYEAFQGFSEKHCNLSASHTHTHTHTDVH